MPIPREYLDICQMLLEATNEGRVTWIDQGDTFIVRLPEFSLEFWSGIDDQNGSKFIGVALKEPKSRGPDDTWYLEEDDRDFGLLSMLHDAARRQARRVSTKLELLRRLLKSGKKVGLDADDNPP